MNSPLLQSKQKCFEFGSIFKSNLSLDDSINLLENSDEENTIFFPLTNRTINENEILYNETGDASRPAAPADDCGSDEGVRG